MDKELKFITVVVVILVVITILAAMHDVKTSNANRQACEEKGGVYLHRTYSSGKSTGTKYTCVRKDVIIE